MAIDNDITKFCDFLDFYKEDFLNTSDEISKPVPNDGDDNEDNIEPLVKSKLKILDFDLMCKEADFYPKKNLKECNRPATVDGLYYKIIADDKVELCLIEFKTFYFDYSATQNINKSLVNISNKVDSLINGINEKKENKEISGGSCQLNYFNQICELQKNLKKLKNYKDKIGDSVEFSLKLKPYESLFVVLPKIYDEYCELNGINEDEKLDFYDFFKSDLCDVKLFIVGKKGNNPSKAYVMKLGNSLEKQYKRLDFVNMLVYHDRRLCFNTEYDNWSEKAMIFERRNKRTLNYSG